MARMLQWGRRLYSFAQTRRTRAMKINKLIPALALSTLVVPATSMAEVSANIGWVSEYLYRGIFQEDSSASAGIAEARSRSTSTMPLAPASAAKAREPSSVTATGPGSLPTWT